MTKSKRIKELKELKEKVKELNDLTNFLCRYNKDEIVFEKKYDFCITKTNIKYLYNGELKEQFLCLYDNYDNEVISNDKHCAILRSWVRYFKLDKITNKIIDITDIYKPKKETKSKKENN